MRCVLRVLIVSALAAAMVRADEAVRRDGRTALGTLTLEKTGKLHFTPATGQQALSPDQLTEIRFPSGPGPVFRGAPVKVLKLHGDQHLTGVFLGLEKDRFLFRTAWTERLTVSRTAAVGLTHLPGFQPVIVEDFRHTLSDWIVRGDPTTEAGAIVFNKVGQSLVRGVSSPLPAGRVGVTFRDQGPLGGARCYLEVIFAVKHGERVLRVMVAGDQTLAVDTGGLAGTARRVAPASSWRRLDIDFSTGSLRIRCDDDILWYTLVEGPGGPLKQVRLFCSAPDKPSAMKGGVAWTDFVVERTVAERRRPPGESGQDELWLAGGDQVFGQVVKADVKGIELKARFGVRRFAWTDLRGWYLQRTRPITLPPGRGTAVRLWLRSGLRPVLDMLEGQLTAMDARQLILRHRHLGELTIPRSVVARLRPLAEKH
jgi:hypothetical protein